MIHDCTDKISNERNPFEWKECLKCCYQFVCFGVQLGHMRILMRLKAQQKSLLPLYQPVFNLKPFKM